MCFFFPTSADDFLESREVQNSEAKTQGAAMKLNALLFLLISLTPMLAQGQIRDGEALLRAMHDRYQNSWYQTVTFTQKSTTYKPDGTSSAETWYEAALLPGRLRIDVGEPAKNNGYIFSNGNLTIVKEGKVTDTRPDINMLLVLGFDVNKQDPATTIKVAKGEGYDLSKLHEDTWEGKPAYVVGAEKGDLKTKQFWVAKDTLLFLRDIEPAQSDTTKVHDIRFTKYQPLEGAWIAARVEMYAEGKMIFSEDYTEIKGNVKLMPEVFDPAQLASTHWEK
jgi:outer membrane lipoprotein-sorting protein